MTRLYKCTECTEVLYTGDVIKKLEEITANAQLVVEDISVTDYMANIA